MTVTASTAFNTTRPWADFAAGDRSSLVTAINALEAHVVGPTPGVIPPTVSATSPDIANSATITPTSGKMRYTPAAARTGLIVANGTVDGQMFIIQNDSAANTMTMAASGTSHVADGTNAVIAVVRQAILTWDATASLWYRTG